MPKVSILMPACNVEKFLHECMDSVIGQTLKDIEIICIDDGSKDSTGKILDEYAQKDNRIKVIHKVNTGYGNSMNVGLDCATGEYIGIIETDDFAEQDMFEQLYGAAKKYNADVVKSNYYTYVSQPEPSSTYFEVLKQFDNYNTVFCPEDFQDIFRVRPSIWSGIYRRNMLIEKKIRFNETPGASYQDTGFAFKIWASAERAVLLKEAYLHYRIDNANSSVKSTSKIFCLCDEYESMDEFLNLYPDKKEKLQKLETYLKYESYRWNYERLSLEYKYCFLLRMKSELQAAKDAGYLEKSFFKDFQWKKLDQILNHTDDFFKQSCKADLGGKNSIQDMLDENKDLRNKLKSIKKDVKQLKKRIEELENSTSFKIGKKITYVPRKVKRVLNGGK